VVLGAALLFGLFEVAVGFAPNFVVAMILLVPTGFFSIYLAQAANHRVQMGVHGEFRGRVMSLYVLVFLGTTPIGASLAGWWGEHFGVPSSIWAAGIFCFVAAVSALVWQLRVSGDRLTVETAGTRPHLTLVRSSVDEPIVESSPVPSATPVPAAASAGSTPAPSRAAA